MKFLRYFLPVAAIFGIQLAGYAANPDVQDGSRYDMELNERDFEALRKYLNTKRDEPLDEKGTNLAISGDVRFEYRHLTESLRKNTLRGRHRFNPFTGVPVSRNDFDCEFNLKFDYIMDRTWAVAHLQFDNSAGVDSEELRCFEDPHGWFGSGKCDDICLRKAFMGYNVWDNSCSRFDVELGRRGNLYHVFDSRVQFLSRFDGVLLKWSGNWETVSEWYWKVAGFVFDERVSHFAYITEIGFLNILDSGFDFKYSFVDWCEQVGSRCISGFDDISCFKYKKNFKGKGYDFMVSQWTLGYNLDPEFTCGIPTKLFAAFLYNAKGKYFKKFETNKLTGEFILVDGEKVLKHKYRANLGWYAGISMGQVKKEGDWAIELQYQVVQALAVPGQDASGIGTGNVYDWTITFNGRDNTNYRGWKAEGLYALTDNITLDTIIEASHTDNPHIGGHRRYSKVELEAIYAF